jgi:hypothetical protein
VLFYFQMNTNPVQPRPKPSKTVIIGLSVAAIFVAFVLIGLAPILRGDGTASLVGAKKDIAEKAINFERHNSSISPMPSFLRQAHVDEVRPIRSDEKAKYCSDPERTSDDPSNPYYYVVTLRLQWLFGLDKPRIVTEYGCDFTRFDG